MAEFIGSLKQYPARVSFGCYLGAILLGTALLVAPVCHSSGKAPVSLSDALFTSTSAVCVTGLTVRSTGDDFSWIGQVVILGLMQVGGIGIITLTTYISSGLGAVSLRSRAMAEETVGPTKEVNLFRLVADVIRFTLVVELAGFLLLLVRWLFVYPPLEAAWYALFHSISAFCNAGFSPFEDSLIGYQGDPVVILTLAVLVVIGGIGFPVILDLGRNWSGPWRERWERLLLHTKLMLIGTGILILVGTLAILALEWQNTLAGKPWGHRLLIALFQAITPRTAGFNSVEIGQLTDATLFVLILLMLIGAGPCSTGGGFKVSTMMVLAIRVGSAFRGSTRVNVFRRTLPPQVFSQATATVLVFAAVVCLGLLALLVAEQKPAPDARDSDTFLSRAFETVSALGTVGLSTGITTQLSSTGRLIIVALMFLGRLGPISVFAALSRTQTPVGLEFPAEKPLIG